MEDILQQGGQIALTALGSLAALFLLTKLSGNKQVSQMNLFDYVMGITIGSIAAEMACVGHRPADQQVYPGTAVHHR